MKSVGIVLMHVNDSLVPSPNLPQQHLFLGLIYVHLHSCSYGRLPVYTRDLAGPALG